MKSVLACVFSLFIMTTSAAAESPVPVPRPKPLEIKEFAGTVCRSAPATKTLVLLLAAHGDLAKAFRASDKATFDDCDPGKKIYGAAFGPPLSQMFIAKGLTYRLEVSAVKILDKIVFVLSFERVKDRLSI